jgi:hypothetical protein
MGLSEPHHARMERMANVLQEAIDALKELPSDAQDVVARAILEYASFDYDRDVAEIEFPLVG